MALSGPTIYESVNSPGCIDFESNHYPCQIKVEPGEDLGGREEISRVSQQHAHTSMNMHQRQLLQQHTSPLAVLTKMTMNMEMKSLPKKGQVHGHEVMKGFCAPTFTSKYVLVVTGANAKYEVANASSTPTSSRSSPTPSNLTTAPSSPLARPNGTLQPSDRSFLGNFYFRGIEDAVYDYLDTNKPFSASIKNCPTIVVNSVNVKEVASSKVRPSAQRRGIRPSIRQTFRSSPTPHRFPPTTGIFHARVFDSLPPLPRDP